MAVNVYENGEARPHLTGHIFTVLQFVSSYLTTNPTAVLIVCVDGKPTHREKIFPGYKKARIEKRERDPEYVSVHRDTEAILKVLSVTPGVYTAFHKDREADDLIYTLALHFSKAGVPVRIHASDNDLFQALVFPGVEMFSEWSSKGVEKVFDDKAIREKYGVGAQGVAMVKVFRGDPSDSIPPVVPRFPSKLAARIAETYEDIKDLMKDFPKFTALGKLGATDKKWIDHLKKKGEELETRWKLVRFSPKVSFDFGYVKCDGVEALDILQRFGMNLYTQFLQYIVSRAKAGQQQ